MYFLNLMALCCNPVNDILESIMFLLFFGHLWPIPLWNIKLYGRTIHLLSNNLKIYIRHKVIRLYARTQR